MPLGAALADDIRNTFTTTPTLWWLGHAGFAVKYANILFYIDPCLTTPAGLKRQFAPPVDAAQAPEPDMVLCTHVHNRHLDPATLLPMLDRAAARCKVVLPKSGAAHAETGGISLDRMTTTDAGLRVEYFKDNLYGRIYSVPSAHPNLEWTPLDGYPFLGYLIRFERITIYHAGDCVPYEDLPLRLKPYNVSVAIIPIGGDNFTIPGSAQLAEEIGAEWLIPMHYGTFAAPDDPTGADRANKFVEHMLFHRPRQKFKIFEPGERWTIPGE